MRKISLIVAITLLISTFAGVAAAQGGPGTKDFAIRDFGACINLPDFANVTQPDEFNTLYTVPGLFEINFAEYLMPLASLPTNGDEIYGAMIALLDTVSASDYARISFDHPEYISAAVEFTLDGQRMFGMIYRNQNDKLFFLFADKVEGFDMLAIGRAIFAADRSCTPLNLAPGSGGAPAGGGEVCAGGSKTIALIVDPQLIDGIRGDLSQFEQDLCQSGYTVLEQPSTFGTPGDVRNYLIATYTETRQQLAGTILIGNIPHAYQYVRAVSTNPNIPSTEEEAISFQYYADLNGSFSASGGYGSPGGHAYSFDTHAGNLNWEIWVGVLPMYRGDYGATVDAINRYFARNHAYRVNGSGIQRGFLLVNEHFHPATAADHTQIMQAETSGQYAWTPFSNAGNAQIYFDSPSAGMSVQQGYAQLSAGSADFTVASAHGNPWNNGQLSTGWAASNPIRTLFFWSDGCSTGNLDVADNFLAEVLYSPTSEVLVARGSSNDSGGMGSNQRGFYGHNIATALTRGASIGDAIMTHVNVPLLNPWSQSREFHVGVNVLLGDPTLGIRR
jgi:hypothetical protein